jgi:predicted HTH transcriptional regulator
VSLEERTFRRSSFESEKNPTMVSASGVASRDGGVVFLGIGEQLIDRQDARCGEASDEPV